MSLEEKLQVIVADDEGYRGAGDLTVQGTATDERLQNAHTSQKDTCIIAHCYRKAGGLVYCLVVNGSTWTQRKASNW
ncbi:MAG: hypothetical protein JO356_04780 [Acidobacteria bacterium]|nr:hypothetical protein [Acidobacteriota bacterium]